jgi:hypothetical protein
LESRNKTAPGDHHPSNVTPMTERPPEESRRFCSTRAIVIVLASVAVYVLLFLYHTTPYDHNLSSLIRFGAANPFFAPNALEPGLVVFNDPKSGGDGYDGQFYYYTIKDFFMGEEGIPNPFRFQRILYPLLAYLLALGRPDLLPLSMLLVNLLAIAASAMLLWLLIRSTSLRTEYLLIYTLNIGFLIAVFYDVATPLCVGLTVAAAYFHNREKLWLTSAMLALAMLAQENAGIVLAAFGLWCVGTKNWRGAFAIGAAIIPWAVWQGVLWQRYGMLPLLMSSGHFGLPFAGMIAQAASFALPGGLVGNLRALSVYPFMAFVILLLGVSVVQMKKNPSAFMLVLLIHAIVGVCFNKEQIWGSTITSPARTLASVFPFIIVCYARDRSAWVRLLVMASVILTLMGVVRLLLMPAHSFYITP